MTTVESWINYTWITINVVYHFISENYKEIISELKVLGENVLRAHLAAAIMKSSLDSDPPNLNPEQYGWHTPEGFDFLLPVVTPEGTDMAPPALIKLVKCGCKSQSPCSNNKCSCKQNSLRCTFLCICHNGDNCNNKPAVDWFASCILLDQAYIWVTWLIGLIIQKCIELDLLFLKLNISARE